MLSRRLLRKKRSIKRSRGFTLVELLVAMLAGLLVAMAAFLLSKNSTRVFQQEARISAAQFAATIGLARLTADLQRAAFLSSPNVIKDAANNGLCGDPTTWPPGMQLLAGINIRVQGSVADHPGQLGQSIANNFRPDAIIIGGAFSTTEEFPFDSFDPATQSFHFSLNDAEGMTPPMRRTVTRSQAGGDALQSIFRAGRLLRIRFSGQTKYMYGVIDHFDEIPGVEGKLYLKLAPTLPAFNGDCGARQLASEFSGAGGWVNPVSRIKYDIRSLAGHPSYGPLVAPISPAITGDNGRTELVRVELDENNNEMANTLELISEYTVDLKFGISEATEAADPNITNPTITRYPITLPDNPNILTIANSINQAGARPERIRSVQIRLSTRTRAPDRDIGLGSRPDGRKLRFLIPGLLPGVNTEGDFPPPNAIPVYARMRTLYTDVAIPNQEHVKW